MLSTPTKSSYFCTTNNADVNPVQQYLVKLLSLLQINITVRRTSLNIKVHPHELVVKLTYLDIKINRIIFNVKKLRDHSFSTCAKFSEKLTFLTS